MPLTISDLMSKMPGAFLPEKAVGLDAVIQFKFTGAESGDWYATIKDGKCAVAQGDAPSPKMTLTANLRITSRSSLANWMECKPLCKASSNWAVT